MLELGLKVVLAYLAGSVMGSLVVGRLRGGVDIRGVGSGNPGGTNALRTQGKVFAFWVIVIDVLKAVIPVVFLPSLVLPYVGIDPFVDRELLTYVVGLAAVVGHIYPVFFDFRGGKGAATAVGVMCVVKPLLVLPMIILWLVIIAVSGFMGLATITAAIGAVVFVGVTGLPQEHGLFLFCCAVAALIVYTHRSNIQRMLSGEEDRVTAGLFHRRGT
ncbi:MAG: glycerol-3-phosphate 1-O-acyltransferase PlsY [Gammaproteobacteria bacterium]